MVRKCRKTKEKANLGKDIDREKETKKDQFALRKVNVVKHADIDGRMTGKTKRLIHADIKGRMTGKEKTRGAFSLSNSVRAI